MSIPKTQVATLAEDTGLAIKSAVTAVQAPIGRVLTWEEARLLAAYRNFHSDVQRFMLAGMEKLEADPITSRSKAITLRLVEADHV